MYIGIIGAMKSEIENIALKLEDKKVQNIMNIEYIIGKLFNKKIVMCACDEGKVNSAIATIIMIEHFPLEYILNMGVAGALDTKLKMCDLVIANTTTEHDFDVSKLGYDKGYVFGINKIYIPCDTEISDKLYKTCNELNINTYLGNIASGDIFVADEDIKKRIKKEFNSICVDMESASIGHVCNFKNIKYVCIRAISDSGNKVEFREFLDQAITTLTSAVVSFLKEY